MTSPSESGPGRRRSILGITIPTAKPWVRWSPPSETGQQARHWPQPQDAIGQFADRMVKRLKHEYDALHRADLERAFLATGKGMDYRAHPRYETQFPGKFRVGDRTVDCVVLNISVSGAKASVAEPVDADSKVRLEIEGVGEFSARVVWQKDTAIGIQFHDQLHEIESIVEQMRPSGR